MYYLYKHKDYPNFTWDSDVVLPLLSEVRLLQGKLLGKMQSFGFNLQNDATLDALTLEVIKSNEIEGEFLDEEKVRSSIARKLGIKTTGEDHYDYGIEGIVDIIFDATYKSDEPITKERLFGWHNALFPTGISGAYKIKTATWRDDSTDPMYVVSGALGKEKVHFQAPDAELVPEQMKQFLHWFNTNTTDDVLKAAIAHLWFVTIHPFEDGNGRIARALAELLLTRSDKSKLRFYSMSAQIRVERKAYYDILEKTEGGSMDVTLWINWFLNCLKNAIIASEETLSRVLKKASFWSQHAATPLNERQVLMLNKLFDGFEGKLKTSKWAKITKVSTDTALRDIKDLIEKGILIEKGENKRNTNYELNEQN